MVIFKLLIVLSINVHILYCSVLTKKSQIVKVYYVFSVLIKNYISAENNVYKARAIKIFIIRMRYRRKLDESML